jgi:gliding motility-associated-like protein
VTDCADSCHFYLPSAFTPNSDGKNDRFTWYGECDPEEFSMEIYNRFGQRVFFSDNPLASWDGKYENAVSPEGVYVYHISYRLPYQQKQLVSGTMMVVR